MVGISFIIHFVCQTLYFLIYVPGYSDSVAWYERYRINKGMRPWENIKEWPATKKRLFYYLGINYFIIYPAMIILSTKISGIKVRFEHLPSTYLILH